MGDRNNHLVCPVCKQNSFLIRYQATYVYSYVIDQDAPGLCNTEEFLPFMYDDRVQTESKQFLECRDCMATFPCYFNHWDNKVALKDLQNALRVYEAE